MKFGIIVGKNNPSAEELSEKIRVYLGQKNLQIEKNIEKSDVVISLGGDGTLIHSACEHANLGVPFVGINVGTLGFLTAEEGNNWQKAINLLILGKYIVSERLTVEARIDRGKEYRAVNEIVVKGMYRVVNLEIFVNEQKFLTSLGDGVIIATQTGSTAYSLSAGGPIVDPELNCFLITPVNAHGLPIPSVVLSPEDKVEIKLIDGEDVSLIIDGQEHTKVSKGQSVNVSKGANQVKLVYFDKHHFLRSLNAKFGLSGRLSK